MKKEKNGRGSRVLKRVLRAVLFVLSIPGKIVSLPVTFYRSVDDLPPFEDYSMEGRTYKFFKGEPLYPFGFGLTYGDVTETWEGEDVAVVTNRGTMPVRYAVLRFETVPHKNLRDFRKVLLQPGETVRVQF